MPFRLVINQQQMGEKMWKLPPFCPSTSWVEGQQWRFCSWFWDQFWTPTSPEPQTLINRDNMGQRPLQHPFIRIHSHPEFSGKLTIILFSHHSATMENGSNYRKSWEEMTLTSPNQQQYHVQWGFLPNKPRPHPPFKLGHFEVISPFAGNPERIRDRIRDLTWWTWMDISTYPWRK